MPQARDMKAINLQPHSCRALAAVFPEDTDQEYSVSIPVQKKQIVIRRYRL